MKTTMGRLVRYTLPNTHPHAGRVVPAILTRVYTPDSDAPVVELTALDPTPFGVDSVPFSEQPRRGHWHWPDLTPDAVEQTYAADDEPVYPATSGETSGETQFEIADETAVAATFQGSADEPVIDSEADAAAAEAFLDSIEEVSDEPEAHDEAPEFEQHSPSEPDPEPAQDPEPEPVSKKKKR
jgi:hypothetical protein